MDGSVCFFSFDSPVEHPILGALRIFSWLLYFIYFLPFGEVLHIADNKQLATGLTLEESHSYSGSTSTCSRIRLPIAQRSISLQRRWSRQKPLPVLSLRQRVRIGSNGYMIDGIAAVLVVGKYILAWHCMIEERGRVTMNEWLGRGDGDGNSIVHSRHQWINSSFFSCSHS